MTMKPPSIDEPTKSFANLAQERPDDGLTDDERMQKIAKEMERKFKEDTILRYI